MIKRSLLPSLGKCISLRENANLMRNIQEGEETDYIVVSRKISTEKGYIYCKIYNVTSMIDETNDQEGKMVEHGFGNTLKGKNLEFCFEIR